jgi:hypothetical protein
MEINQATIEEIFRKIKSDIRLRRELANVVLDEILRNPQLSNQLKSFFRRSVS